MRERRPRIDQRERTLRAFGVYLDVLDAAERMRSELHLQLAGFDLTIRGFRMLEILYRHGPTRMTVAAKKLQCSRQNVDCLADRLEERGWVKRYVRQLTPSEIERERRTRLKRQRGGGRTVGMARLTKRGEKFIGRVFPKHAKVVKSLMRVLDAREQLTLSFLLRKLREGDFLKFVHELRMQRPGERGWEIPAMTEELPAHHEGASAYLAR